MHKFTPQLKGIIMDNPFAAFFVFAAFAAWLTHIVTCLSDGLWGFLVAGALVFPIGIIHGIMIWVS